MNLIRLFAVVTLSSMFLAQPISATGLVSGHYVFRARYAPVCLNGTYPITIGYVTSHSVATIITDLSGGLSGELNLRGLRSGFTGSISLDGNHILILAQTSGPNPTGSSGDLYAYLHGRQFFGSPESVYGETTFTMDVSSAAPLDVTFDVILTVNGQGQVIGNGTASSCAVQTPVTVTGTNGANCTLHIVGTTVPQFTWDGSGPPTSFGFVATWTGHGYGLDPTGAQLPIFAPNAPGLVPYVTSRKNHILPTPHNPVFTTGDVPLSPGVECRSGGALGAHQLVISFPKNIMLNPPNGTPAVRVSSGIGSVSQFATSNNEVVVNLTGVADAQTITLTLSQVSDGTNTADVVLPAKFLLGDISGNGVVNSSDISLVKSKVGSTVSPTNCRGDINLNGAINSSDVSLVKSKTGTGVP